MTLQTTVQPAAGQVRRVARTWSATSTIAVARAVRRSVVAARGSVMAATAGEAATLLAPPVTMSR